MRILISAGEASGEMYGAQLMEALRIADKSVRATLELEFFGVGGEKMRAAGCEIVVDSKDLAVVGITEILGHLPKIWALFHNLIAEADRRKPDLAIVIDSPAFNWRVARQMKKRGVPVVYYVCPQFWAWRQGRVRLLRKYVDKALVIFPFEEKFYRDRGVDAEFVGHPLAEVERPTITREQYALENGLVASKPWITLMPGSRVKEVRMNLPAILEAARMLGPDYEFLLPVAPTLGGEFMKSQVEQRWFAKGATSSRAVNHCAVAVGTTESRALPGQSPQHEGTQIHLVPEALPALAHSRAGIIASGTATVEAAMMGLPFVMVYRVTPLTYWLGRSTVKVPYFAMVNLIAGKKVVPELVQNDFTAGNVTAEVKRIIPDGDSRSRMLAGLEEVRKRLGAEQRATASPAEKAANAVLAVWQNRTASQAR